MSLRALVALGLLVAGVGLAGYGIGRGALLPPESVRAIDSTRIADAAAAKTETAKEASFAAERTRLMDAVALTRAAQPVRIHRTQEATQEVNDTLAALMAATKDLPALHAQVVTLKALSDTAAAALTRERVGWALAQHAADSVMRADTLELNRRRDRITDLTLKLSTSETNEASLRRQLDGWHLAVTIGPGLAYGSAPANPAAPVTAAPVQLTAGLSHRFHIPLPHIL